MSVAIITGISGQDGAYLAKLLLEKGYKVIGLTRSDSLSRIKNLDYLQIREAVEIVECDLLDFTRILHLIKNYQPDEIYNLAAQSSVGQSFSQPIGTIQFNITSVLNILEAIRLIKPDTRFYQASSSEMYGKVTQMPVNITTAMHPLSPYAISKAAAHWTVINYRESYGLFACNGVLFNHESYLRHPTFFIKKVVKEAVANLNNPDWILRVGNIEVSRDFGYSPMYVEAMWLMLKSETPKDYIICSGKSYLLKDLIFYIFDQLNISREKILVSEDLYRPTEIMNIYGDNSSAKNELKWAYDLDFYDALDLLIKEEQINQP